MVSMEVNEMRWNTDRLMVVFGVALTLMVLLFGAVAPGYAALPAQETTPVPVDPGDGIVVTQVIPDTGADNDANDGFAFSGWTLLILLGIVIVVLLVALLARGSGHTHV